MPKKKKQRDYIPVHPESELTRSKEYKIKGTLSEYPVSRWKKTHFKYGLHFSRHVRGIFLYPHATIKRVLKERVQTKDIFVPLAVVLIAGILTGIGGSLWQILITPSIILSIFSTVKMAIMVIAMPVWFIALWLIWTVFLHVISSVMAGSDVLNMHALHKMLKVVGFAFVPAFLNILPLFSLITAYWTWILCAWSVEMNYNLSKKSAFLAAIPLLFTTVIGTFLRLGLI